MKSVLALALAATLSSCSYSPPGPPVEQAVAVALDSPRVQLLDAGSGQRSVLAFADIGNDQELELSVESDFSQRTLGAAEAAGYQPPFPVSPRRSTLALAGAVEEASPASDGQQEASRNIFFTTAEPAPAAGFQFGWRATDDGRASTLRLAAPLEATDEQRQLTESAITTLMSLPLVFPTEAIGPGARWTVDSRVTGETALLQTTTYQLESIGDGVAQLRVTVAQRPSLSTLEASGFAVAEELEAEDAVIHVLDAQTTGGGSLTVDLSRPLPIAGEISYDTVIVYGNPEQSELSIYQASRTGLSFRS